jgi:hypothetical protein
MIVWTVQSTEDCADALASLSVEFLSLSMFVKEPDVLKLPGRREHRAVPGRIGGLGEPGARKLPSSGF